jgi:hypothetical protein
MIETELETCVFVAVTMKAFVTVRLEANILVKFATPVLVMFLAVMGPFIVRALSVVTP